MLIVRERYDMIVERCMISVGRSVPKLTSGTKQLSDSLFVVEPYFRGTTLDRETSTSMAVYHSTSLIMLFWRDILRLTEWSSLNFRIET